jgi:hypothetical protein
VAWDRVDVLIPETYFEEPPLAEDLGGRVETLCFVDIRARETATSASRRFAFRLPARLQLFYSASSEEVEEEEKVRVFTSRSGEVFVADLSVVQGSENVSEIFRALASARIRLAGYTDMAGLFVEGARINGTGTGVNHAVMEGIISEMARWKGDPTVLFRVALGAGKAGDNDFTFVRLKDLPRLNGVFTGIGFEDIQLAVQSGVRKTMSGEAQRKSPMEEIARY